MNTFYSNLDWYTTRVEKVNERSQLALFEEWRLPEKETIFVSFVRSPFGVMMAVKKVTNGKH